MAGEIIQIYEHSPEEPGAIRTRLEGVLAILQAIEDGELLAAFPECEMARTRHSRALTLLGLAERELLELCRDASA